MATWQNIEDVVALWHREANEPAWCDLEHTQEQISFLAGLADDGWWTCKLLSTLELHDTMGRCADALRPELRLGAANQSALKSRGW
jgi:hypothetical protein